MTTITNIKTNTRTFVDLDLNFNIHPIRKDINLLTNEMAIITSMKNLILTSHYERPFNPDLGSNMRRLLFEPLDNITSGSLQREIKETISNFEPRVSIKNIKVSPSPENNSYNVEVVFYVINSPNPITISFFLERIR